jgi:hypothetical protein
VRIIARLARLVCLLVLLGITFGGLLFVMLPVVFMRDFSRAWRRSRRRRR